MVTMTKREFYTAIANDESLSDELRAYASAAIQKLDETNAKRAAKPSKASIENGPLVDQIVEMLTDEPKTASDLAEPMELGVHKVSSLLQRAVKEGRAISCDVKIPSKGTQKGYTKA